MYCPKCGSEMQVGTLEGMRIERCPQCFGIWFQEGDHHKLRKVKGAEQIDTGPADLGRDFNGAFHVPCPVCSEPLARMSEPSQPHIHIDCCDRGHGVFFDAGEYRDFRDRSVGDLFKRLLA